MKFIQHINLSPYQLLIFIFLFFILVGSLLLKLPIATTTSISWIDALFTATSAMTVTGLIVVDTPSVFTTFGEVIIVSLIQLGGLGIMSFAVLIYMMLGKKIGLKERMVIQQSLNQTSLGGVIKLVKNLFIFSISIEIIGLLILSIKWVPEYGWWKGIYYSFFHSISAFNNAGFALWSDSLMGYTGDPTVNIGITFLFITGGIGFTVLMDVWHNKRFKKLSLHSKLMIIGTFIINVVAIILVFVLEYNNPKTLAGLPSLPDKLWAAYFQGVVPRTAGFNTLDIASINESTAFLMIILMFIGAGSASTGGGIKVTTFLVIIFGALSFLKGKQDVVLYKRTLPGTMMIKALAISTMSLLFVLGAVFILTISENAPFLVSLFEVVSAFGTVGMSMGLTFSLSFIGKLVIIFMMFFGKIGPLTLAFSLAKPKVNKIKYPNGDILTG
ncbi:TrkH family potassium uptake protein [Fredinandcohnia onubensis]|uniref:TrkH family potassium uptake protein n=1 Tax=Fredinandcohnia onubensis TaxID=1571209 RepID=UPI000C0C0125|nr:TrkH family potassium uptake protein [Fredinandcohnia onubensis]